MFGNYMTLVVVVIIGSAIFLAIGFAIAGWAKNEDQAAPVANLISLPMMFLSGVFFPRDAMPDFLAAITALHAAHLRERGAAGDRQRGRRPARASGPQLLGMAVWAVITFVIAVRLFKWE